MTFFLSFLNFPEGLTKFRAAVWDHLLTSRPRVAISECDVKYQCILANSTEKSLCKNELIAFLLTDAFLVPTLGINLW